MEPKVKYLFFCEQSQLINPGQNQKIVAIQPLTHIQIPFDESLYSFTVIIGIDGLIGGETYQVTTKIKNDDKLLFKSAEHVPVPVEEDGSGAIIGYDIRNQQLRAGTSLHIAVYIDGKEAYSDYIRITKRRS